jgi:nucleoid-associated protein YgaU
MYAVGHGIKPWRAPRANSYSSGRRLAGRAQGARYAGRAQGARYAGRAQGARYLAAVAAVCLFSLGFALAARGGAAPGFTTVVVQPGDTLWSIAAEHYPQDDVRVRVDDIEQANGLDGPTIEVGRSLKLPT